MAKVVKKPGKARHTKEEYIRALVEARGLVTVAADRLQVTPWAVYKYMDNHPDVKRAQVEAQERLKDFAEAKLYQQISEGNTTATIFFLKTQARNRGYVEKVETGGTINVVFEYADEPISRPDPEGQA